MIQPDHPTDEARRQDAAWRAARARMKAVEVSQRPGSVKTAVRIAIAEAKPEPTEIAVHAVSIPPPVIVDGMTEMERAAFNRSNPLTIADIQRTIAKFYSREKPPSKQITVNDIISARRTANVMLPRQVGYYLAKTLTLHSLPVIGKHFGGRDHTTALSGIRKIERLRAQDPDLDRDIRYLTAILKGEPTWMLALPHSHMTERNGDEYKDRRD